ncbi:RHS repeat-associated core domain-containing protein, partial [Metapseudomonas otitidis]|uniref:RHS repeat-associated core domain-containing protein n=1 Tax=Metapseudomonas otitidis TaxID=319939 RepID=UPI0023F73AB9
SLTWNNGIVLNRTYDQDYQLTAQQVGTWQSQYSHDANGNITAHAHSLFGSLDYQYDALDRLTEEKTADSRKAYAYDATGNRTSRTTYATTNGTEAQTAKQSLRYAPDSNRLAQRSSSYAVEADAAGHYTRYSQSRRYTYDDQGRLSAVTDAVDPLSTRAVRYTYNALGQRVLKEVQQGTARTPYTYLYGPDGQVMGQVRYTTAGRKSQASYYVWLDSLPIAQIDLTYSAGTTIASTTLTYLHSDHLNTPRLATNQGGNLVWSWPSDAFGVGQPNAHGSAIDVILRFPGQVADAHSGLYYNYFRDYDPETGRYVESDPIGLRGGLNSYSYVSGNPLTRLDIFGLTQEDIDDMLELASTMEPDLKIPDEVTVKDLGTDIYGDSIVGFTNPLTKNISLDDRYLKTLTCPQYLDLYEQITHESIHATRPRHDMILRPSTHQDIYDDAARRTAAASRVIRMYCPCEK